MFRKRKTIAPYFRLPNPTNPITGDANYLYPPKKEFTRFVLTEAMTTEDENADAEIEQDSHSWGPEPIYHSPKKIHVHNQLTKVEDVYQFSGEIGDVGLASWDANMEWRILYMLVEGLVELCAQETAERNVPYTALLGTWNPDTNIYCYDNAPTVYAIDHRKGPPLAESGWKGLYQRMPSTVVAHNGFIYVNVSLDCELPEEGCNECGEA